MNAIELDPSGDEFEALRRTERPTPEPGPGQVRVRLRAASLNYRDLSIAWGTYPGLPDEPFIPLSDGAGRVDAVGEGVTDFEEGDRVVNTFSQVPPTAPPSAPRQALGSPLDGTLAEYQVFHESGLLHVPETLSLEAAATLPCAAHTAWHALFGAGTPVQPGQTVLALGTGGVSIFALQFAAAAGARTFITSSSDEKLARAEALGADETINYERTPDWHEPVLDRTDGTGVDCVVEVGGTGTLERSFQSVAPEGKIGLIGVLTDADQNPNPHLLMQRRGHLHGIYVGAIDHPRDSFAAMNAAVATNDIEPVVDRTFALDEVRDAYQYQADQAHVGKVVISI